MRADKELTMTYLAVNELKRSKDVWKKLDAERELVITRDGKPCAILVGVSPDTVESDLAEVRRALFSAAVTRGRVRARRCPPKPAEIDEVIRQSRRDRGIS
jgi:antitoxin (DNA-binding transcriptional repressor) of toxin-antitoxin stability system